MEMVSAAKMRKAVANVLATRSYASLAWDLVKNLAARTDSQLHPLLKTRSPLKKIGLILITSNRGLCGGFNSQIISQANRYIKHQKAEVDLEADLVIMGKKGQEAMFRAGQTIIAEFNKLDITTASKEITPLSHLVINDYLSGRYDKVVIAYTDFVSTLAQKPRVMQLLPIINTGSDKDLGFAAPAALAGQPSEPEAAPNFEYIFEPTPRQVLDELLPRLIEMQIYQAILESDASEHSARMIAMRNATDAATEMISDLTLAFNKARQASITAELADISGGRLAME
ncbi:MAG: ATP synthase gamma chain [Parcubacteria group bacterium GW2011_GWF2_45_11]|nr:MAG: ATP synthase gamma chain [Parcubacteria group bacterium GW2011_GWF2_45_11]